MRQRYLSKDQYDQDSASFLSTMEPFPKTIMIFWIYSSIPDQRKDLINLSILAAIVIGIGNKDKLFTIDLIRQTLPPILQQEIHSPKKTDNSAVEEHWLIQLLHLKPKPIHAITNSSRYFQRSPNQEWKSILER